MFIVQGTIWQHIRLYTHKHTDIYIVQLFRERLLDKAHVTTPKLCIVGSFEFTVFQRNFGKNGRRGHGHKLCLRALKESNENRFDSYSVRNSVLSISHNTFRDCPMHIFSDNLSRNSCYTSTYYTVI